MGKKWRGKKYLKFEIHCSQWILKIASINQFKRFDRRDFETYKECYIAGSMTAQAQPLCYMYTVYPIPIHKPICALRTQIKPNELFSANDHKKKLTKKKKREKNCESFMFASLNWREEKQTNKEHSAQP